jgi:hypothetical protein
LEALHVGDGVRDSIIVVMVKGIEVSVDRGGWVVHRVFSSAIVDVHRLAFIVVPVVGCRCVMSQCGHMTLLAQVGDIMCVESVCGAGD